MRPALAVNLGLRFCLELAALAALGWWGAQAGSSTALHIVLAIAAPLAAAVVWGLFVAPKARVHVGDEARLVIELAVFAAAAVAFAVSGHVWPAVAVAGIAVMNSAFVRLLGYAPGAISGERHDSGSRPRTV
jgi:hypothetical protein